MKHYILCDIDGTIADNKHRQPLLKKYNDWDEFFRQMLKDKPLKSAIILIEKEYQKGKGICFITGRPERFRKDTTDWLKQNIQIENYELIMREDNDHRNKVKVKKEMLNKNFSIEEIDFFLENDDELIALWRSLGIKVIDAKEINLSF